MTDRTPAPDDRGSRLEELVRRFAALQAEIEELSGGELDALVPAGASSAFLLPGAHEALLRQEQEFRALVEHSPDPIARFGPDGRIHYANPAMQALLGAPGERLHGRTLREAGAAWGGMDAWEDAVFRVGRERRPAEEEIVLHGGDGEARAYACRLHPEFRPDGALDSVLAIARETTVRWRAAEEVRESRAFLQAAIDALSAHLAVVDAQGNIVAVNEAWRRFGEANGATSSGLGQNYLEICGATRGDESGAAEGIRAVLAGDADFFSLEYPCATPTRQLWFQMRVTPLLAAEHRYAVVAHEDATAEHVAREEAEAERDRAVRILESVTDAFFTVDADWIIRYVNPQAEPLLRRSRAELLGRNLWDTFPGLPGTDFERVYREVAESGRARQVESYYPPFDAWFDLHVYPSDGGVAVYFRDVTERRQREQEAALFTERLAEERSLLNAVVQQLPVGVIIAEAPSGRLILGNKKVDEIWRHGFMSSRSSADYGEWEGYHPDGRRVRAEEWPLARALRTGRPVVDEAYEIVRPDGRRGIVRLSAAPVADARGDIIAGVVIASDVTEEVAAAHALQASEERYRLLFRATNDVLWDWDIERGTLKWNEALTAVLHHEGGPETATMEWWEAHIHPDDRDRVLGRLEDVLLGRDLTWSDEYRFQRADGGYVRILDRAYLLRDEDGRAVRMVGSMLDLSERDRVEDAVRLQALLLDTVQQAVIATDLDDAITSWNPYAEQLYGWRAEEVLGLTRREIFAGETDREDAEARAAHARGESWTGEMTVTRRDGRRLTVISTRSPVLDSSGRTIGVVGVSADLTEQRSLEEQLRQSQKMEAVGMLAGGVAHDFNNVLTVIGGNVSLLLADTDADDPRRQDLGQIAEAAERAAGLTRQLLAFSRRQILRPQSLDVSALVSGLFPMLKRLLGEDVDLHFQSTGPVGNVEADPGQLEQVLMNLAVNARDAISAGGRISFETAEVEFDGSQRAWDGSRIPTGRYAMLAVSDTGTGMPPDVVSRVFEPFFTTKEVGRGTGLGLSTVYGIVRQSGGYVWVHSEVGVGSVFKIYLPTVAAAEPVRPVAERQVSRGSETILLVEDEDAVRMVARRALTRFGYTVVECRDGMEAIEMAERHRDRIALVLMDVVMPNLSGHAAATQLEQVLSGVPVIFMSGYTDDEVLRRGVLKSEALFLQKPFTPWALLEMVRATLDRHASPP
ncbi:MAG TPA: PAS domain S-box protein [Longimicrobium sp.]|jgi:PAS domain S-box-containing protein|uniref:hybrid sensor histidine kinase/response regulator n=1 Tax=Longimicrobium sp. TaxID=2029185 RepID=UPI002ED91EC5